MQKNKVADFMNSLPACAGAVQIKMSSVTRRQQCLSDSICLLADLTLTCFINEDTYLDCYKMQNGTLYKTKTY